MFVRSSVTRAVRPIVLSTLGSGGSASGGGSLIPASLRQLLYTGNQPAYYTEEQFPGYSHLLKDYSSGVGSLRPKRLGYCYDFDGVDDYVSIPHNSVLNFGTGDFSVSMFVKTTQSTAGILMAKFVSNVGFYWYVSVTSGKQQFYVGDGTFTHGPSSSDVNDNQWHHLCVSVNRTTDIVTFYLDGVADGTFSIAARIGTTDNAGNLRLSNTSQRYDGKMFDPRIYSDVLTADEVTYLYTNGQSGTDPGTANLVAHYPLQEESGTVAYDISGNGNHGTITNAVTSGVGSIHQPDAGVTKGYPNDEGYSRRMVFDGVDDCVEVTGMISHTHYFGACTISAKVYITNLTSNQNIWALGLKAYRLLLTNLGEWSHGNNTATGVYATLGEHELSVDYDALGRAISFSVDGAEVWTGVGAGSNSGTSFFIGSGDGSSLFFKGLIWDFAITGSAVKNFAFEGYGNTDADWVDTTGGDNNGTVNGSPDNVYIPAATTTLDALGGTLTETGEVPRYGTALGYGWQGDGSTVYFSLGSLRLPIGSHTFSFWYYNTSGIASHRLMDTRVGSALYLITANAGVEGRCQFAGKSSTVVVQDSVFTNNAWHFIEITQTGTAITCDITPENGTTKTLSSTVVTDDITASPIYFLGGYNYIGSPSVANPSNGIIGPVTITTGGVTTSFHPIPGTRDVAKVVSNAEGSVISNAVVNGVLADLYTIGDGSWRLPHIENGARWSSQNLVKYSEDLSNAIWVKRNGCTITQIASEGPSGQATVSRVQLPTNPSIYVDCYQGQTGFISNADVGISFWLKDNGSVATSANFGNRSSSTKGYWTIDLTALSAGWNFITASHPAVTVVYSTKVGPAQQLYYGFFIGTNEPSLDVLVSEVQINYGTEPLPYEKTVATAQSASALIPAGPGQANAVNGNPINIPANVAPRGLLTDRTGGVIAPLDYAMGTDEVTQETFDQNAAAIADTISKRFADDNYSDRYGAGLVSLLDDTYFGTNPEFQYALVDDQGNFIVDDQGNYIIADPSPRT